MNIPARARAPGTVSGARGDLVGVGQGVGTVVMGRVVRAVVTVTGTVTGTVVAGAVTRKLMVPMKPFASEKLTS
ncbi:MAG TPA: hypothetical protein VMT44_03445, partial [Methanoregula sp.]|nr:hypothetical protein [Methanoregula sp.]